MNESFIRIAVRNGVTERVSSYIIPPNSSVLALKSHMKETDYKEFSLSHIRLHDENGYLLSDNQVLTSKVSALSVMTYGRDRSPPPDKREKMTSNVTGKKRKIDFVDLTLDEDEDEVTMVRQSKETVPRPKRPKITSKWYDGRNYFLNAVPMAASYRHTIKLNDFFSFSSRPKAIYLSGYCVQPQFIADSIFRPAMSENVSCQIAFSKHWLQGESRGIKEISTDGRYFGIHPKKAFNYTSVHAKLWMIQFDDRLRVVVTSANLTLHDFSSYSNTFWVQDFPRKIPGRTYRTDSAFESDLKVMFGSLADFERNGQDRRCHFLANMIENFDYSEARGQLILSLPGIHYRNRSMFRMGLFSVESKLKLAIERYFEEKREFRNVKVEEILKSDVVWIQTSTVGQMNNKNVDEFKTRLLTKKIGMIFPSVRTANKTSQLSGLGMMFFRKKVYNAKPFPKDILHDFDINYQSSQRRALSHSKIVLCPDFQVIISFERNTSQGNRQQQQQQVRRERMRKRMMWTIVGSHNFTKAAWGTPQNNHRQVRVNNFELGVLLVKEYVEFDRNQNHWPHVCKCPPPKYRSTDLPYFSDSVGLF